MLDRIPRNKQLTGALCEPLGKLSDSLNELKTGNPLFATVFEGLDVAKLQSDAEKSLLEVTSQLC